MGGFRRRVSVANVLAPAVEQHGCIIEEKFQSKGSRQNSTECLLPLVIEAPPPWVESLAVGGCYLSLRTGGALLPGLACLEITVSRQFLDLDQLLPRLDRIMGLGLDLAVTLDFRDQLPDRVSIRALAELWSGQKENATRRPRYTAVLVRESIFRSATWQPLVSFIRTCAVVGPLVLCHGDATAQDFFRAGAAPQPAASVPFVSIVDVQDATGESAGGYFTGASCVASLAPFSTGPCADAHTFHMLPNGDVRVIQSPPGDVMWQGEQGEEDGGSVSKVPTPPVEATESGAGAVAAVASLKFGCPREQLMQLVGAHLHLGELVVDAELESLLRSNKRPPPGLGKHGPVKQRHSPGCGSACIEGLNRLLDQIISVLVPLFDESSAPPSRRTSSSTLLAPADIHCGS